MSASFLRRCLTIGAIIVGIALVPAICVLLYVGYYLWVPRYSAVAELFDPYGFNLRLDLYLTDDEMRNSGRYINVITSGTYDRFMIPGWGWSRMARTSVYRIDGNHIAVLSALGNDYEITLQPLQFAPVGSDAGERWQYIGAFDFTFPSGRRPRLQFFDQSLAECVPMGAEEPSAWVNRPRVQARHANCPVP
jgi:hypothetical protein